MKIRRRAAIGLLTACAAVIPVNIFAAGPAYADRCEPEEIVLGPNTSAINEADNPACTALFFYVYPFICATDGNNPPSTLIGAGGCTSNIRLRPTYVPPVIPPYNPNVGRAACNLILYANPTGACVFTSTPETGNTFIHSSLGALTIPALPVPAEG